MAGLTKKACLDEKHDKGDFNFSPVGVHSARKCPLSSPGLVDIASKGCVNELAITQPVTIPCVPRKPSLVANNSGCVLPCQPPHPSLGVRIKKLLTTIKEQHLRSLGIGNILFAELKEGKRSK